MATKKSKARTRKAYTRSGASLAARPWVALTDSQKELRLDTVGWSDGHDIFAKELIDHPVKRVRTAAAMSNQQTMVLMIRAHRQGVDLAQAPVGTLATLPDTDWHTLPRAPLEPYKRDEPVKATKRKPKESKPAEPLAAPPKGGNYPDLESTLNDIVCNIAGPPPPQRSQRKPLEPKASSTRWVEPPPEASETPPGASSAGAEASGRPDEPSLAFEPLRGRGRPSMRPDYNQTHGEQHQAARAGAIPEPGQTEKADDPHANPSRANLKEIAEIRSKLVIGGKVRLDLEALAVYLMCPSYFAVATGLDVEPWQGHFLDSYSARLGCLASRQSGKSIVTARKAICYATTSPATTTLILAPTLRQSSELLLKCSGVASIAGLRIAGLSQFQLVLGDKQPGALSRIVCLPGSNEDSGASTRGYSADLLILEEAAFLNETVISSVLPSIAARPKAQLIGISSAGIIGTYFHSVMTSPQSRWEKMIVPAPESGRFTKAQLEELKLTLGARYGSEMLCQWSSQGDSIYDETTMRMAFGTDVDDASMPPPELDPDAAFGHLNLDELFAAQPFAKNAYGHRMH